MHNSLLCNAVKSESFNAMSYVPQVDDYVIWNDLKGWVYFKCDQYITIEIGVKDKTDNLVQMHKKTHCCVLCFPEYWGELEYVKNRRV